MAERKDMSYYEDLKHRLETFAKWSKFSKHKPKDLAEAGFVYTGTGDQVLCFSCGGVVKDLEETDDCWVQHTVYFPHCKFLTSSKDLRVESNRLNTFKNWKNPAITPEALANAGFYYLDNSSFVRCAFCNIKLAHWKSGDNPMDDHMKYSFKCPLVRETAKQGQKSQTVFTVASAGRDVCGNHAVSEADAVNLFKEMIPSHKDVNIRLKTFDNCSRSLQPKTATLAEAGFYYKGVGDQVTCFHCGGGLAQWKDEDDPWEQHALWFPQCNFLKTTKGQGFIDQVRGKSQLRDAESVGKESGNVAKCKICFSNETEVVFIPCRHFLACMTCSLLLNSTCPVCREPFERTMRVFSV